MTGPEIITDRLLIRNWRQDDGDLFHRINSDPQVMEFFAIRRNRAEADSLLEIIRDNIARDGYGFMALELRQTGECMGFAGLNAPLLEPLLPVDTIEIGWRLAPEFWGHGYASEAARALLRFGFETLQLDEIVSFAVSKNERSTAVMRRLGMRPDPVRDFDHPRVPDTHPHLKRHVLYALSRDAWQASVADADISPSAP